MKTSKFTVGQVVHHKLFDYRGVIIDVHPCFDLTDAWYDAVARSRPPKDQPWYRVLPDGASHETYVAERNLEADDSGKAVRHPEIERHLRPRPGGGYRLRAPLN
jgi:heat shock protein HspQ